MIPKKYTSIFILALFVTGSLSFPLEARYKMGKSKPIKTDKKKKRQPHSYQDPSEVDERPILRSLAHRYEMEIDRLVYLRSLHHGYDEIVPALIVAREAQVEVGRVLVLRIKGKSWKDISEIFFVELDPLNEEVLKVLKPIRKFLPKKIVEERPEIRAHDE